MFNKVLYERPGYNEDFGVSKNNLVYPFQSIMDIVDADYTREDLERVIINSDTNCRIYTFEKFHENHNHIPSSRVFELTKVINNYKLIYIGKTDDYDDWYYSMSTTEWFILKHGSMSFGRIPYAEGMTKLSGRPIDEYAMESFFDDIFFPALEAEDFTFSDPEPVESNDGGSDESGGDDADNGGDTGDSDGGESSGESTDLTAKTQETLQNDPAYAGTSASDNDMNSDANAMGDSPDDSGGMDDGAPDAEEEDDDSDDTDDEGTASKKRIRKNLVKLHTVIRDSLESMGTFTPAYNADSAKRYYKIQNNLSIADDIIIRICNEQINDLTVDDLMKKYVTLCQIYDISTRALKSFAEEYKEEAKLRGGKQVKRDTTGERAKTW